MKKHILITGSTDGIGKLAAIKFAKDGHAVYVHGRNSQKVSATIKEIKSLSHNDMIEGFIADFSDLTAVKQMAKQISEQVSQLDVVINNAGIFKSSVASSKEGYDLRFAVNYLAPYLLTKEFLPLLKKGADARLINLSSAAQSEISYEAMLGKKAVTVNSAYAQSKLALTMWSFYLANQSNKVSVIAVNPGSLLNTKMVTEAYGQYWSSADKGADIIYELSISDKHKGVSGQYFDNDAGIYNKAHADAYNDEAIKKLIEITEKLIE